MPLIKKESTNFQIKWNILLHLIELCKMQNISLSSVEVAFWKSSSRMVLAFNRYFIQREMQIFALEVCMEAKQ